MENLIIPVNYRSELNLYETQEAIKTIKDFFQQSLSEQLTLLRVTAPLFVAVWNVRLISTLKNRTAEPQKSCSLWQNGNVMH